MAFHGDVLYDSPDADVFFPFVIDECACRESRVWILAIMRRYPRCDGGYLGFRFMHRETVPYLHVVIWILEIAYFHPLSGHRNAVLYFRSMHYDADDVCGWPLLLLDAFFTSLSHDVHSPWVHEPLVPS